MRRMEVLTNARLILAFFRKRNTYNRAIAPDDEYSLTRKLEPFYPTVG